MYCTYAILIRSPCDYVHETVKEGKSGSTNKNNLEESELLSSPPPVTVPEPVVIKEPLFKSTINRIKANIDKKNKLEIQAIMSREWRSQESQLPAAKKPTLSSSASSSSSGKTKSKIATTNNTNTDINALVSPTTVTSSSSSSANEMNLNNENQSSSSSSSQPSTTNRVKNNNQSHSKYVEVYRLDNSQVLRIFPSQKDAAEIMQVSQGGISQTCNGIKPECYGLGWRFYVGPPIHDCKYSSITQFNSFS